MSDEARRTLLSIVAFWLFYFFIVTLRAAVVGFDDQMELMGRRVVVALVGMGLTFGLYMALRPFDRAALRGRVAAAALLSVPFAALFAAFNYAAFYVYDPIEPTAVRTADRDVIIATENRYAVTVRTHKEPRRPIASIADGAVNWYFFFAAWAALHMALSYAAHVRQAERRAATFRDAARDAELRALRYQVNPHFLFNTLNSLSTLVMRNRPEEAERMILNLSTFFRTSLTAGAADDLTLADEVRLQRLYLDIEAVRFPDRLRVAVDLDDRAADACIPGLLLQPLVENAIKYGVSRASRPVTITIRGREAPAGRLALTVLDDGPAAELEEADTLFELPQAGTGTGLRNVRERLAARFGDEATMRWGPVPEGFAVRITMPLMHHGC